YAGVEGQTPNTTRWNPDGIQWKPHRDSSAHLTARTLNYAKDSIMSFMNRSGSFGAILPTFFTHQQPTQEPTSIITEEKPKRKWSDIFRGRSIDTTIARSPSTGGTMVSPNRTASPIEAGDGVDGTFERIIPATTQPNEKGPLTGKTLCEEEKPGNGHVWDIWPIMPKTVRRWDKPDPIPIAHMQIPAGSLVMNRRMDPLPEGWTMFIHPEGKPYYHRVAQEPEENLLQGVSARPLLSSQKASNESSL
ncbi:16031_t:CDS:2, partial [Acaulospora colombiana]